MCKRLQIFLNVDCSAAICLVVIRITYVICFTYLDSYPFGTKSAYVICENFHSFTCYYNRQTYSVTYYWRRNVAYCRQGVTYVYQCKRETSYAT